MNKVKSKYLIFGIVSVLLVSIGVSFAYWRVKVVGEGAPINVKFDTLKVVLNDPNIISSEEVKPGWSIVKTFTIENQSDGNYTYNISIKNLINTFVTEGGLQYKITSLNGYNMADFVDVPKSTTAVKQGLAYNVEIAPNVIHSYTIEFRYQGLDVDQSIDMGKEFSGNLSIEEGTPDPKYLYGKILADKTTRPGGDRPNLDQTGINGIYTTSNTKTLYQTTKTENGKASYYFAGNAQDNWVLFAGNYWRIIRINEDNSVRLLYVGPDKDTTQGYISTSRYNSTYNKPRYVGYMYGNSSTDSLTNDRGNNTSSTIKGVIDSWYSSNITGKTDGSNSYDKYVSRTAIYCNDRSIGEGSYSTSATFYFGARTRLDTNKAPSYKCGQNASTGLFESSQATVDKFSGSTSGGGNGKLTYPVALMTADEVAFAGGAWGTNAETWYYYNAAGTGVTGSTYWWTMSPYYFISSGYAYVFYVRGSGGPGGLDYNCVNGPNGVRPVLSLKSCVKWSSGDGSSDNPYTVTVDEACATDLN